MKIVSAHRTSAISGVAIGVVIAVVVVVDAVGGYLALSNQSTLQTSSITSSLSTTSSQSASQSGQSTTLTSATSTNSTSTSGSNLFPILNTKDLLGNFSQMKLSATINNGSTSENATVAFLVAGHPIINGSQYAKINYTVSSSSNNESALIYYNSNYTVVLVSSGGQNYSGSEAKFFSLAFVGFFDAMFSIQTAYFNSTLLAGFQNQGTSSQTFGNLTMPVTTYTATNVTVQNATVSSATIKVGQIPSSNLSMLAYLSATGSEGGQSFSITLQLISATQA